MTLLALAFRAHRTGLVAAAALGALVGALQALGFAQVAGTTPAERAAFGQQMAVLGKQLSYILPEPRQLDTMAGYVVWRAFGTVAVIFAFWALLAGVGASRGDEERGLVEEWLSLGVSRRRWIATRLAAFALALAVALVVTFGATALGAGAAKDPLAADGLALQALAMGALAVVAFALGLAVSQLVTTGRAASSIGAVILVVLFAINAAARSGIEVGAALWLSPFALYDRSTPMLRGGSLDAGATLALVLSALVLSALASLAFGRRDLGGPLVRVRGGETRRETGPSRDPLLRLPVLAALDQRRLWIAGWAVAIAWLGGFLTAITRTIVDSLASIPSMRVYFERAGVSAYSDFVGAIWFSIGLLVVSFFVIAEVNGWAADDAEGRLEVVLAAPISRARVVLERLAVVLVAVAVLAAASGVAVAVVARANDITLPGDRLALASLLVLPVGFAFAGIGHALVGWRPRVTVVLLGAVAAASFFIMEFAPLFDWPDWVKHLSLYELYGTPLAKDDWGGIATLLAVGVAGTAVALVTTRRRDVGR